MTEIIIKLLAMLCPVALGYFLKQVGFFGKTDYRILAKIAINITLPCTVVASFAKLELDRSLISISLLAFIMNILVLLYAFITSKGIRDRKLRCMDMFSVVGFNMGNFLIPFAQQFMGTTGVAVTALFDAGNSPMCTGGHYIAITTMVGEEGRKTTIG
ncbi:MAG: AEC family transporter, partial [Oscillospiraceae bacterium]|nr:AEC family transporter [Oscillospiraceae bacterium]